MASSCGMLYVLIDGRLEGLFFTWIASFDDYEAMLVQSM